MNKHKIIREQDGIAVVELDGQFYTAGLNRENAQFYSVGSDSPKPSGRWFGGWSDEGLKYVASGRTRASAMSAFRRAIKADGKEG